jgi:hypothetical protein
MKYGPSHGNYQHGNYSQAPDVSEFNVALAKDLLRRILTTPCDSRGELPFPIEEQQWALRVAREQPEWSRDVLRSLGIPLHGEGR